jgi:F-box domain
MLRGRARRRARPPQGRNRRRAAGAAAQGEAGSLERSQLIVPARSPLEDLPGELLENIFGFLTPDAFAVCRRCSRRLRSVCNSGTRLHPVARSLLLQRSNRGVAAIKRELELLMDDSNDNIPDLAGYGEVMAEPKELNKAVPLARRRQFGRGTSERLSLFKGTVDFLERAVLALGELYAASYTVADDQLIPIRTLDRFVDFLQQMRDVLVGLADVVACHELGEGFDMADLALWRYCFSFEERVKHSSSGQSPIVHAAARAWWNREFGNDTYAVQFQTFYDRFVPGLELDSVENPEHANVREEMQYFLGVFLNFPEDHNMNAYKFNLLDQTLGPMDCMAENFRNIVLGAGFVGLVNRERARQLLAAYFNSDTGRKVMYPVFLLRFSRTRPEQLVASVGVQSVDKISVTNRLLDRAKIGDHLSLDVVLRTLAAAGVKGAKPMPIRINNQAAAVAAFNVTQTAYSDAYEHAYDDS